jgi:hypothetical protein
VSRILPEPGAVSRPGHMTEELAEANAKEERMACLQPEGEERADVVGLHGTDVEEK